MKSTILNNLIASPKPIRRGKNLTERDLRILKFIWRWKVVSLSMIHHKFFKGRQKSTSYNRLNRLYKYSFISRLNSQNGLFRYWTINKRGYKAIQALLPEKSTKGYSSENLKHDAIVTATHLGEQLDNDKYLENVITEQEIRTNREKYISEGLNFLRFHRPDGVWRFRGKDDKELYVNLEVELSSKKTERLRDAISFYEESPEIKHTLWAVSSKYLCNRLWKITEEKKSSDRAKSSFFNLDDLYKKGWEALPQNSSYPSMTFSEFIFPKNSVSPIKNLKKPMGFNIYDFPPSIKKINNLLAKI